MLFWSGERYELLKTPIGLYILDAECTGDLWRLAELHDEDIGVVRIYF